MSMHSLRSRELAELVAMSSEHRGRASAIADLAASYLAVASSRRSSTPPTVLYVHSIP